MTATKRKAVPSAPPPEPESSQLAAAMLSISRRITSDPADLILIKPKPDSDANVTVRFFLSQRAVDALFGGMPTPPAIPHVLVTGTAKTGFTIQAARDGGIILRRIAGLRPWSVTTGWRLRGIARDFEPTTFSWQPSGEHTITTPPIPSIALDENAIPETRGRRHVAARPEKTAVPTHILKRLAMMLMDINDLVESSNGSIRLKVDGGKLKAIAMRLAEMEIS